MVAIGGALTFSFEIESLAEELGLVAGMRFGDRPVSFQPIGNIQSDSPSAW